MDKIYGSGPDITDEDIKYVVDALKNHSFEEPYNYVEMFEKEFAEYHGRKYALMTPSCTTAIHLLLMGLGVKAGDEVVSSDLTWIGSVAGIKMVGAKTVFADIERKSWCVEPSSVEDNINENTKAIIAVNLYGNMCDMKSLEEISERNNIPLIEDAAESLGSVYYGRKSGNFGKASVFSFHRTKSLTCGEGGILLTDDENLYNRCSFLRDHGRNKKKMYWIDEVAVKYMPSNMVAALAHGQFLRLDELIEKKRQHYLNYKTLLKDIPFIQLNQDDQYVRNGCWITSIVFDKGTDNMEIIRRLAQVDIPARPFFFPLSSMPAYKQFNKYMSINCVAYNISNRGISLPGAFNLTFEQQEYIGQQLKKALKNL
jgi:perosamine synthetase